MLISFARYKVSSYVMHQMMPIALILVMPDVIMNTVLTVFCMTFTSGLGDLFAFSIVDAGGGSLQSVHLFCSYFSVFSRSLLLSAISCSPLGWLWLVLVMELCLRQTPYCSRKSRPRSSEMQYELSWCEG